MQARKTEGLTVNQSNLQQIVEAVKNVVPLRAAYLFGSYAYGEPNSDSDFDIYLVADSIDGSKHDKLVALYTAVQEVAEKPTDVLLNTKAHYDRRKDYCGTLEYKIEREGIRLYEHGSIQ